MDAPGEVPDNCLMRRYIDGDENAFGELFRRYEQRAYGYFLRRTGCAERASDLYQELFLRVHRARAQYDPERPFAPWFFRIAARLLVDDARRAFRRYEVQPPEHEIASCEAGQQRRLEGAEEAQRVLGRLSREERRVLVGAKLEGLSYAELASELGKSIDAVKKLASRAMQRLRATRFDSARPRENPAR